MSELSFELQRTGSTNRINLRDQVFTWSGTVGSLGAVEVAYPTERADYRGLHFRASVTGQYLPATSYFGREYAGRPSLAEGELSVAGNPASLSRNAWGLTRRGRALRIAAEGREYVYAEHRNRRGHELRRSGAGVRMTRSHWKNPQTISGICQGAADGLDISLAILLESVYTRNLSVRGALVSAPGRVLSRLSE
ncbi:hypothetical protein ACQUSR_09420 [Streptomyces sp. P1-3]|uniref:hypothetical protein n=1 Tax=Streptomyces sp. P1-3 TaxID=3421658 RepID=UPI003D360A18